MLIQSSCHAVSVSLSNLSNLQFGVNKLSNQMLSKLVINMMTIENLPVLKQQQIRKLSHVLLVSFQKREVNSEVQNLLSRDTAFIHLVSNYNAVLMRLVFLQPTSLMEKFIAIRRPQCLAPSWYHFVQAE